MTIKLLFRQRSETVKGSNELRCLILMLICKAVKKMEIIYMAVKQASFSTCRKKTNSFFNSKRLNYVIYRNKTLPTHKDGVYLWF